MEGSLDHMSVVLLKECVQRLVQAVLRSHELDFIVGQYMRL